MLKKNDKIRKCFDNGSLHYDNYSELQKQVCNELVNFYKICKTPDSFSYFRGLDLGSGTGQLSCQLCKVEKFDELHLVDFSKNMIELAKKKVLLKNASFQIKDFDTFSRFDRFNFIFSNMSLHWSRDFEKLFSDLVKNMTLNSNLLISFPNSRSFTTLKKLKINVMNELPDEKKILRLINKKKNYFKYKELFLKKKYRRPLDFFYDLRNIGANASTKKTNKLFHLRKLNSKISVDYNISFIFFRKLKK